MPFTNRYPYTDFHELNLDWFLEEFKKVTDKVTDLDTTVQQFTEFVTNYFDNLDVSAEVEQILQRYVDDGTIAAILQPMLDEFEHEMSEQIGEQNTNIAYLTSRMDGFASLPSGSTAGNAEILDQRVSIGGVVYASAGNAVRHDQGFVDDIQVNLLSCATAYQGYFLNDGPHNVVAGMQTNVNWGFFVVPVKKGMQITISGLADNVGGAKSAWLNSSDPNDFLEATTNSQQNNGTFICKTDWYAICLYNPSNYIDGAKVTMDCIKNGMKVNSVALDSTNVSVQCPDLDNLTDNIIYKYYGGAGATGIPANMPFSALPYGGLYTIINIGNTSNANNTLCQQIIMYENTHVWYRQKEVSWGAWKHVQNHRTITVGSSGCDYTALVPAIRDAVKTPNTHVIVKDGTYDWINEFETYVSATFFSNYNYLAVYGYGLYLENGIVLEMTANSKIVCNYTGNDDNVRSHFSPFVGNYGDFTLKGVTIEAMNCMYAFHDDNMTKNMGPCKHIFEDCSFTIDNRGMAGSNDTSQCIGGGLDKDMTVEIRNCYFNSWGTPNHDPIATPSLPVVSYHNALAAGAKSFITINGCYLEHGTIAFGKYGNSTLVSNAMVNNNSLCYPPRTYWEDPNFQNDNIRLMAWNNEIR